jgi:hypothetical protein
MDYSKLLPGRCVASPFLNRARVGVPLLADQEPDARCFSLLDCVLTIEPTGKKTFIKKVILPVAHAHDRDIKTRGLRRACGKILACSLEHPKMLKACLHNQFPGELDHVNRARYCVISIPG